MIYILIYIYIETMFSKLVVEKKQGKNTNRLCWHDSRSKFAYGPQFYNCGPCK